MGDDTKDTSFFDELEKAAKCLTVTGGKAETLELRRLFESLSGTLAESPAGSGDSPDPPAPPSRER